MRRVVAALAGIAIIVTVTSSAAEPTPVPELNLDVFSPKPGEILHILTPIRGRTEGGTELFLPRGYFLDEQAWSRLDDEMRRLQDTEVRLQAENKSLRKSIYDLSVPWVAIGIAFAAGVGTCYMVLRN